MSELPEGVYKERRFARSHGLIPRNFKLNSSRAAYKEAFRHGKTTRVSGIDVARAGGNVNAARATRRATGAKPRATVPKGAGKASRTAKAHFSAMAKAISGKRNYKPKRVTRRG